MNSLNLQHTPLTDNEVAFLMAPVDSTDTILEALAVVADYEQTWMLCTDITIPQSVTSNYINSLKVLAQNELRSNPNTYARLIAQQLDLKPNGMGDLVF